MITITSNNNNAPKNDKKINRKINNYTGVGNHTPNKVYETLTEINNIIVQEKGNRINIDQQFKNADLDSYGVLNVLMDIEDTFSCTLIPETSTIATHYEEMGEVSAKELVRICLGSLEVTENFKITLSERTKKTKDCNSTLGKRV